MAASKVLNAKRKEVTVTYELMDGTTKSITVQSLSTNESKEITEFTKDESNTAADLFEKIARIHLQQNDADTVNRIIEEQYTEGNMLDFASSLSELIEEVKKGK